MRLIFICTTIIRYWRRSAINYDS